MSSFELLRFGFCLSFEPPTLSQTGVCLCTGQLGFVGECVCVCVLNLIVLGFCVVSMGLFCALVCVHEPTAVLSFIRMLDMCCGLVHDA